MNFAESQRNPGKHPTGLIIVIVMHVLLAWALVSGLARKVVDVVKGENTTTIEDVKPPPPPPPPEKLPPPPPNLPPPPVYTPPPEVQVNTPPPPNTVVSTSVAPPAVPERPIAATPPGPPAPPAQHYVRREATFNAADPACVPDYPPKAMRAGAQGTTRLQVTISATGKVTEVKVLQASGPTREHRDLDRAAQEAFGNCPFKAGQDETGAPIGTTKVLDYVWRIPD